jgi:hypothetical protein
MWWTNNGICDTWYRPVRLDDPAILAQGELRPAEGDPWTHQQVAYAVAMSVFERFLGRRFRWRGGRALVLVPHAFESRNAFDPDRRAVLFGYYRAELALVSAAVGWSRHSKRLRAVLGRRQTAWPPRTGARDGTRMPPVTGGHQLWTVASRLRRILSSFGVSSRAAAVATCLRTPRSALERSLSVAQAHPRRRCTWLGEA